MNVEGLKGIAHRIVVLLAFSYLSAGAVFGCTDNWVTVADGSWTSGTIWSVNGGAAQVGPPSDEACISIAHNVVHNNTMKLDEDGEVTIQAGGSLRVTNDAENEGLIAISGVVRFENSLSNKSNGLVTVASSGSLDVGNDLKLEDCGTSMDVDGLVTVGNSLDNKGDIAGEGIFIVTGDAKNADACASFAGLLSVCDSDGSIDSSTGSVAGSIFQSSSCAGPLPIELGSFAANAVDGMVELRWQTASETHNLGFELQHSTNARDFEFVHWVDGSGTNPHGADYRYSDLRHTAGTHYYRLVQQDYDGNRTYLPAISVNTKGQPLSISTAPNPVGAGRFVANITFPETTSQFNWQLFDVHGTLVRGAYGTKPGAGKVALEIPVATLPAGMYVLIVRTEAAIERKQVLVL